MVVYKCLSGYYVYCNLFDIHVEWLGCQES